MRRLFGAAAIVLLGLVVLWLFFGQAGPPAGGQAAYAPPGAQDAELAVQPASEPQTLDATPAAETGDLPRAPIPYDQLKARDGATAQPASAEKRKSDENAVFY